MKTVLLYYSWSGHTAQLAAARAQQESAQLVAVRDRKRPSVLKAYTAGALAALRMHGTDILPLGIALDDYDKILLMAPVWAGHPAPAANSVFALLPRGKSVEVVMVSASGSSSCQDKVRTLVEARGCTLTVFENCKA